MADNTQLPPPGGPAEFSAVAVQPGSAPGRALLTAGLLVAAGALLGLLGGVIWAAAAPRVVYQVYSLRPPTAFATNPETNAFIAADAIYTFIALGGGALLGLAGYLLGVRRYGPVPMVGVVLGGLAAAFLAQWLGPVLTGQDSFTSQLGTSKPGTLLRAPIALGAHGALAFWPVAAAFVAGGLELATVLRARQASHGGTAAGAAVMGPGRHAQRSQPGPRGQNDGRAESGLAGSGLAESGLAPRPAAPAARPAGPEPWFPADPAGGAPSREQWQAADPAAGPLASPFSDGLPPDPDGSVR